MYVRMYTYTYTYVRTCRYCIGVCRLQRGDVTAGQQVYGVCIHTYVPWKVEPLFLQVGVEPLHDLVQEVHTTLQPLIQVGHLGGFQYL